MQMTHTTSRKWSKDQLRKWNQQQEKVVSKSGLREASRFQGGAQRAGASGMRGGPASAAEDPGRTVARLAISPHDDATNKLKRMLKMTSESDGHGARSAPKADALRGSQGEKPARLSRKTLPERSGGEVVAVGYTGQMTMRKSARNRPEAERNKKISSATVLRPLPQQRRSRRRRRTR